jgi:hypothetical protein
VEATIVRVFAANSGLVGILRRIFLIECSSQNGRSPLLMNGYFIR